MSHPCMLNFYNIICSTDSCASAQRKCTDGSDCLIQYCDGSASVPRGVVFAPVVLSTGRALDCVTGSTVVDNAGDTHTNCSSHSQFPRM